METKFNLPKRNYIVGRNEIKELLTLQNDNRPLEKNMKWYGYEIGLKDRYDVVLNNCPEIQPYIKYTKYLDIIILIV